MVIKFSDAFAINLMPTKHKNSNWSNKIKGKIVKAEYYKEWKGNGLVGKILNDEKCQEKSLFLTVEHVKRSPTFLLMLISQYFHLFYKDL